jgi:type I restriction enzyme, S subunit
MSDLPSGWVESTLGEMARWGSGGTPKAGDHRYYGGGMPWAVIGDLNDGIVSQTSSTITEEGLRSSSARVVPAGTVLIAMYGSIGKLGIAGVDMATNQAIAFADPLPGLEPTYLFWYLRAQRGKLGGAGKGATQKNISQTVLKPWPLPLAPVNEQRRIVAAIEEQFSRLDAAEKSLLHAQARLDSSRAAVYSAAMAGEWATVRVGDLLREPLRNGHSAKAVTNGAIRTLTLSAVTRGEFIDKHTKLTNADPTRVENLWLKPGDVLIERSNTPELVGTAALYRGPEQWAIFPDLMIRIRVRDDLAPEYLEIALKSRTARRYFRAAAQGIAGSMPKIDQATVEQFRLRLPPLDEQRRIVAEVERQLSVIDAVRSAIDTARRRSATLRRSILERAFRGELVEQDPSDEPASALLDRIRADRVTKAPPPRRRRVTA